MNYLEVSIAYDTKAINGEVLLAEVAEIPFESFVEEDGLLVAYILKEDLNEKDLMSLDFIRQNKLNPVVKEIEQVNWNEEWEKNFDPVIISDDCVIKADFHQLDKDYQYTIRINPKMSFGTGHHATTALVLGYMLNVDFENQRVLDMGTGTGVLAVLAAMKGATDIWAIDNNIWAYENSLDNVELNGFQKEIKVIEGEVELIKNEQFDYILANINKNVIKAQLGHYFEALKPGGKILISGILADDLHEIKQLSEQVGFKFVHEALKEKWSLLVLSK